jgi:hypothetical protein
MASRIPPAHETGIYKPMDFSIVKSAETGNVPRIERWPAS